MLLSADIKPEPNPPLTRERVLLAREMYAQGFTVARILAHCQMSLGTLYACLDGNPFAEDDERWPPIPRRRQVLKKRRRALRTDSVSLLNRLLRTAERQVRDIEVRLAARETRPVERERDVRMLTSLTRALRDLRALEKSAPASVAAEDDDYDQIPEDIDALRRELTAKLNVMAGEAGEPAQPSDDGL